MRALASLLIGSAVALVLATVASPQRSEDQALPGEAVFVFVGRGYGHGVGMSQYGAYGMASEGRTYEEILAHYYPGTTLATAPPREVRVLLAEGRRAVSISSSSALRIADATGAETKLPAEALVVRSDLRLPAGGGEPQALTPPVVFRSAKRAPIAVDSTAYRGRIELTLERGLLRVVNVVPLEAYLESVVPAEMPSTWPVEALKAQAVAARSYALASLAQGKPFHLYADVRSQVYLGVAGEKPATTRAVRATSGQVLLYGGQVARTLYFSTSGGRTASAADVYGTPTPYLVSRPDPWDRVSPYHRWGPIIVGARELQTRLGLSGRVLDLRGVSTPSGRLRTLIAETTAGSVTLPSALLRSNLELRSTWVTIGVLRLDRPTAPVTFGSVLELRGLARGVASPALEASEDGRTWSEVGRVSIDASGLARAPVRPTRSTRYRLRGGGTTSPALLVHVAPRVELGHGAAPGTVEGSVKPRAAAAKVVIERQTASGWTPVGEAALAASGAFTAPLPLKRGVYRARVVPSGGYVEAVTPPLAVGS
ncbi:MAG: SpoIID/LytB domain-containing protein [Gaiellaceae bacterium]|nr:SpoIID/LytB domain-containing protein [Gaiellaceae bacterium]